MNCCENCIYALYDSVPYGSTNVDYLSGCKKEDEITDAELENEVVCHCWVGDCDDISEMEELE